MKLLAFIALCILGVATSPIEGPQTAIVNGNDVPIVNTITFHVHLLLFRPNGVTQVGSGVFIGSTWVVTVAQNLKADLIDLRCGFGNRIRDDLTWLSAVNFFRHPDYNANTLDNNIGLIMLPSNPTALGIAPIQMAIPATVQTSGTQGMIYGFGFTTNEGAFATVLQQALKTIETDAACLVSFPHLTGLLERNFCANGFGVAGVAPSMCAGDQGGPYVVGQLLVGISSFQRSSNCLSGQSSGFVRVSAYREWILTVTGH